MNKLKISFVLFAACLIQNIFAQAIGNGCNSLLGNGITNSLGLASNLAAINSGVARNFGGVANNINNINNLAAANAAADSGVGYGDVAVQGELPVGGNTCVSGNVPVVGYVSFEGIVPAGGIVSVATGCGANNQLINYLS